MANWYALQTSSEDGTEKGSYDVFEAEFMLKEQGEGWMLTIDDETKKVITKTLYEDIFHVCDVCGKVMSDGFYVEYGEYYCSKDCLHQIYTEEEYMEMYENDEAYWTDWL